MKKTMWMVVGAVLAASVVAATAQNEVLALNSIGYIKKQLPPGGDLITVSLPLHSMTAENHVFSNLSLATEAPPLSVVSFWDADLQEWGGGQKSGKTGWPAEVVTQVVASGEFFFLKGPDYAVEPTEITITGELPSESTLARSVPGSGNIESMANPYPVDFVFGTSSLASNAATFSVVSFWDADRQEWGGGQKGGKTGWPAEVVTQVVSATEGFFLREAGVASQWTVDKPYTWP